MLYHVCWYSKVALFGSRSISAWWSLFQFISRMTLRFKVYTTAKAFLVYSSSYRLDGHSVQCSSRIWFLLMIPKSLIANIVDFVCHKILCICNFSEQSFNIILLHFPWICAVATNKRVSDIVHERCISSSDPGSVGALEIFFRFLLFHFVRFHFLFWAVFANASVFPTS